MPLPPTIIQLLSAIAALPSASRIVVFGSVARRCETYNDLDVALCVEDSLNWEQALRQHTQTIDALRLLARQHYGWLDPSVVTKAELFVRNSEATGWARSKQASQLKEAIQRDGVPVLKLVAGPVFDAIEADAHPAEQPLKRSPQAKF